MAVANDNVLAQEVKAVGIQWERERQIDSFVEKGSVLFVELILLEDVDFDTRVLDENADAVVRHEMIVGRIVKTHVIDDETLHVPHLNMELWTAHILFLVGLELLYPPLEPESVDDTPISNEGDVGASDDFNDSASGVSETAGPCSKVVRVCRDVSVELEGDVDEVLETAVGKIPKVVTSRDDDGASRSAARVVGSENRVVEGETVLNRSVLGANGRNSAVVHDVETVLLVFDDEILSRSFFHHRTQPQISGSLRVVRTTPTGSGEG